MDSKVHYNGPRISLRRYPIRVLTQRNHDKRVREPFGKIACHPTNIGKVVLAGTCGKLAHHAHLGHVRVLSFPLFRKYV